MSTEIKEKKEFQPFKFFRTEKDKQPENRSAAVDLPQSGTETGNGDKAPDAIENSVAQVYPAEQVLLNNPFIRAEESEEYKKLEREYKEYRTKKVLARIDSLISGSEPLAVIKEDLRSAAALSRAKIIVLPCLIQRAKKELPNNVRVETLVNYPYAGSTQKAVLTEIRAAIRLKANVCAAVNLSQFASDNYKPTEKQLKSFKKLSGKVQVIPMFSTEFLNPEQIKRLAVSVKAKRFSGVKILLNDKSALPRTADAVKIFYEVLGEQCPIEVVGCISRAEDAETLFNAGADRIITTDYRTLSRQRLDGVSI